MTTSGSSSPLTRSRRRSSIGYDWLLGGRNTAPSLSASRLGLTNRAELLRFNKVAQRIAEEELSGNEKLVRAKVDKSKQLYKKSHANKYIRGRYTELLEQGLITQKRLTKFHMAMASQPDLQFWRDPDAMHALASNLKPVCNGCHEDGLIVDKRFMPIKVKTIEDVLAVEDYEDWGIFVAFEHCPCSHGSADKPGVGYRWVKKADVEMLSPIAET